MKGYDFSLLKNRDFRLLVLTRMCAVTAMQAQAIIVGWQVYSLTGSAWMLGLTGLAEAVPAIACAFYAGHIVDVSSPRRIYRLCLAGLFLNTLMLLATAGGFIPMEKTALLVVIYSGIFISGLARSFIMPCAFALLPQIVSREGISSASSWQTAAFQVAAIGGPTLAGLIYAVAGASGAWMFPVLMMGLAVVMVTLLQADVPAKDKSDRPPVMQSIREGWAFLLENRTLLSIMSLDMLAVLFGGAVAILPAFADQVLDTGPVGLGFLRSAPAMGAILTALYFAGRPLKIVTARRLLIVVGGFGVSMVGFGLSTSVLAAVFFLALSGAFDSVSMVIRGTLMQLLTPEHMRGRVSAVNSMFIISSNEIGAFESGAAATLFGLVPSIILGGLGTIAVVGAVAALSPKFRALRIET
ncbi:MAG: MFS transporter [Alphaproteobacteria bacterium]|nr:MFS transporter [Alphaproteobacteria bacterium]QQS57784.1 MAG: MFS transporter [Alphaproteobacteria bacterium]